MEEVSSGWSIVMPRRPTRAAVVRILTGLGLALALVVGVGLRWGGLGRQSLWFDEGYTAWVASLDPADILRVIRADTGPPLYYLLLHYWTRLLGDSEAALRSLSAVAGTLSLGVVYLLARRLLGARSAVLLAVTLFASSPLQIWYSQEARVYEWASLLALMSLFFLTLRLQRDGIGPLLALIVSASAMLYLHNIMAFYLLALDTAWLVLPGAMSFRRRLRDLLVVNVAIALVYLPWVPTLLQQMQRIHGNFWSEPPQAYDLIATLGGLSGLKYLHRLGWMPQLIPLRAAEVWMRSHVPWSAVAVVGITASAGVYNLLRRRLQRRVLWLVAGLLLYGLLPLAVVYLYSHWRQPLFIERVFLPSSGILALLLAAPLAWVHSRRLKVVAVSAAIVLVGLEVLAVDASLRERKEDWRSLVAHVARQPASEPRLTVFVSNEGELLFRYYGPRVGMDMRQQATLGLPAGFFERSPPQTMLRVLRSDDLRPLRQAVESGRWRHITLVSSHPWWADEEKRVARYLDATCRRVDERAFEGPRTCEYVVGRP